MNRRALLSSTSAMAVLPVLIACGTTASATLSAQVIADVNGALAGLANLPAALEGTTPAILTQALGTSISADIVLLQNAMATISTSTALQAGVTVLARVFGGLNTAVSVLSAFPIPPPYSTALLAVSMVLPSIQAYLTSLLPVAPGPVSPPVAALAAKATNGGMDLAKARSVLHIPTISS